MNSLRKATNNLQGRKSLLIEQVEAAETAIKNMEARAIHLDKARAVLIQVAQMTQKQLEFHISELVTLALSSVFDEPYQLQLDFVERRGKTEVDILFCREGEEGIDPLTASGGGAVDVACLALRIALWNLKKNRTRNVMVLDEPFRNLTKNYQPAASQMIKEISEKLGLQFIIVSQDSELIDSADRVFDVCQKKRVSICTQRKED